MAPKIFITGVTGYVGGDALHVLYEKHPDWEYAALVRTEQKAEAVKKAFPKLRIVIGNLDDASVLEKEAAAADVVIHTADASDHEAAARAIAKGLAQHTKDHPGFWLHTGGAGILAWEDMRDMDNRLGTASDRKYNDWTAVHELTSLPSDAFHRNVDEVVLEAGRNGGQGGGIRTAIVCPPTIFGGGRGPNNSRSRQVYELAKFILKEEYVPIIGKGQTIWNNVHVHDLSEFFVLLTEAAVSGKHNNDAELWGEKGYFLTNAGEHNWADLARKTGKKAVELGFVKKEGQLKEEQLSKQEALDRAGFEAISWGLNSRGKADRANKTLGWAPVKGTIENYVEEILRDEKERLDRK
ncbi:NAD(P)-binding protein [Periconia macrospinosa]|uniref:NAD(P)-binding protein n=1 Tax=Periconia macrospinosa TaxID=97972 RepID=A0A2V1E944_9PLEO|nr:NAD(P)-binding protein [Periconia macrospinosa]